LCRTLGEEDFAKLSERAAVLTPFQKRFLYLQMSKELEQHQKQLEGQQSGGSLKETQNAAKCKFSFY
jgi:hypothetical protein